MTKERYYKFYGGDLIVSMENCLHFSDIKIYDPADTVEEVMLRLTTAACELSTMQMAAYTICLVSEMPPKYRKQLIKEARDALNHAHSIIPQNKRYA